MGDAITLESFDSVIFDLGGVIVTLTPEDTVQSLSALFSIDAGELYSQAKQLRLFDELERGEISNDEFRKGVARLAGCTKEIDCVSFDTAWNAMLGSIPKENLELIKHLSSRKRVFLLSNTNGIHIDCFLDAYNKEHAATFGHWETLFEVAHYSHEIRMRKPEPRIFEKLVEEHQLAPQRTLFIDDNRKNVEVARTLGLRGVHHPTNAPLAERFSI